MAMSRNNYCIVHFHTIVQVVCNGAISTTVRLDKFKVGGRFPKYIYIFQNHSKKCPYLSKANGILIIHVSECISGSATCIENIYNVANQTRRPCRRVRFAKHCECPKSCCTAANA